MDKKIIEGNRKAWNTAFGYHKKARDGALHKKFADPNFTSYNQNDSEQKLLRLIKSLDLKGKTVAHMQTNNGRELLSLMRVSNPKEGVGFDISEDALAEARELATIAKVNAKFECVNILEIPDKYNGYFDFIYITEGSISWLPCVEKYFKVMARLLKPGGQLLMSEIHPVAFVLSNGANYSDKSPQKMSTSLDYIGGVEYEPEDCHWYMHMMSDIIMALQNNGFAIKHFQESTDDTGWMDAEGKFPNYPRSFVMLAELGKTE